MLSAAAQSLVRRCCAGTATGATSSSLSLAPVLSAAARQRHSFFFVPAGGFGVEDRSFAAEFCPPTLSSSSLSFAPPLGYSVVPPPSSPLPAPSAVLRSCSSLGLNADAIPSILRRVVDDVLTSILSPAWYIKRTFQPSIIRKRRKTGFLKRRKTVGGRRVLKRRLQKGRKRLAGC